MVEQQNGRMFSMPYNLSLLFAKTLSRESIWFHWKTRAKNFTKLFVWMWSGGEKSFLGATMDNIVAVIGSKTLEMVIMGIAYIGTNWFNKRMFPFIGYRSDKVRSCKQSNFNNETEPNTNRIEYVPASGRVKWRVTNAHTFSTNNPKTSLIKTNSIFFYAVYTHTYTLD